MRVIYTPHFGSGFSGVLTHVKEGLYFGNEGTPKELRTSENLMALIEASNNELPFRDVEIARIPDNVTEWVVTEHDGLEALYYVVDGKLVEYGADVDTDREEWCLERDCSHCVLSDACPAYRAQQAAIDELTRWVNSWAPEYTRKIKDILGAVDNERKGEFALRIARAIESQLVEHSLSSETATPRAWELTVKEEMGYIEITDVNDDGITFSDGSCIEFDHDQDCCEYNYADFRQLDDLARVYKFKHPILFEAVEDSGFRFGDSRSMFFVPCYSYQNGYYSSNVDIYYTTPDRGKVKVLNVGAELRDD